MRVAVAGGTGVVGHHAVASLRHAGHEAVVLSRRTGVDLSTGTGLREALGGVEAIIDTSNAGTRNRSRASAFFTQAVGHLQAEGARSGVRRLLVLSIVGIDRVPLGYYRAKLDQEVAGRAGPLPCTVVRATQFHEFPLQVMTGLHLGPLRLAPAMPIQPVAAASVGQLLSELVATPPEMDLEVAGPQVEDLVDMARKLMDRSGMKGLVVGLPVPGAAGRAMRRGALIPREGVRIVGPRFDEWLTGDDWRAALGPRS